MIEKYCHIVILLLAWAWTDSPNFVDEELKYSAGFRFFPAGEATLSFSSDSLNGEVVYVLTTFVKTNSFLDAFYVVREKIQSWLNPQNFSLQHAFQTIRECSYHRDHTLHIQGDSILVWNNETLKLPGPVYDPIAFIYYLRSQDLSLGDSFKFSSVGSGKVKEVIVHITKVENIKVSAGVFNCLKIDPVPSDGRPLIKNNGEMRVWLSDDSLKLPVKIEQKTNLGIMVMKLKDYSHSTN